MRVSCEAKLSRDDRPLLYHGLAISNTCSHAKNRNDPVPITWSKVAFPEVGFSAVAILGGGWLQSPASDGPPCIGLMLIILQGWKLSSHYFWDRFIGKEFENKYPSSINVCALVWVSHYTDVIMSTKASQVTSLTDVYSTVCSDADQRKHQSSASLAFVWGIHQDRWIPRTKGQLRGNCFHLMTSSCVWLGQHHEDVKTWKRFPHYWPLMREIRRSHVDLLNKAQYCGNFMFSLMLVLISY